MSTAIQILVMCVLQVFAIWLAAGGGINWRNGDKREANALLGLSALAAFLVVLLSQTGVVP